MPCDVAGSKCEVGCFLSSTLTLLLLLSLCVFVAAAVTAERKTCPLPIDFEQRREESAPADDSLLQMREHSGRRSAWLSYFKLANSQMRVQCKTEMITKKHKHHLLLMQSDGDAIPCKYWATQSARQRFAFSAFLSRYRNWGWQLKQWILIGAIRSCNKFVLSPP